MIHIVKGFSVVSEAEGDVFLEFLHILYDPANVGNLISGSSALSKSTCTSRSSRFTTPYYLGFIIALVILLSGPFVCLSIEGSILPEEKGCH